MSKGLLRRTGFSFSGGSLINSIRLARVTVVVFIQIILASGRRKGLRSMSTPHLPCNVMRCKSVGISFKAFQSCSKSRSPWVFATT